MILSIYIVYPVEMQHIEEEKYLCASRLTYLTAGTDIKLLEAKPFKFLGKNQFDETSEICWKRQKEQLSDRRLRR